MKGTFLIEVGYKKGVVDPVGRGLERTIKHLRLGKVSQVTASQLYRVAGDLSSAEQKRIASDLLCDPVVQEHRDGTWASVGESNAKGKGPIVVDVWYKNGVTDVVGESVAKGIQDMKISRVESVRAGARYRFWGLSSKAAAEKVALALLVNPLVQDQLIHGD